MRSYRWRCFCLCFVFIIGDINAATNQETQLQIEELREELEAAQEDTSELSSDFERSMKISGYTDVEYTLDDGTDKGFRLHHTNLYLTKQVLQKWRFFAEIEFENAPVAEGKDGTNNIDGKIFVEATNIDFQYRAFLSFRFGRMFTPAGIWLIDHDPPSVPTQERPLHIRNIFPQVVDGVMMYGVRPFGNNFFKYNLYAGNGEGNDGGGDQNEKRAVGAKFSFILPLFTFTEIGASAYQDDLHAAVEGGQVTDKLATGVHARLNVNNLHFQTEYASADLDSGGVSTTDKGYYAQLYYDFTNWTVGGRYDVYEQEFAAVQEQTRVSAFINYHIGYNVLLKLEHHMTETDTAAGKEDTDRTIASIVVYLGD